VHRITDIISPSLETKTHCEAVFLDVAQGFNRVWSDGLLYKLRFLPAPLFLINKSFLTSRSFAVRYLDDISHTHHIMAGLPQGSILVSTLYNIFTSDIPHSNDTFIATFADDTDIISPHSDPDQSSKRLQDHMTQFQSWFHLWKIKINESKSSHITFTLRSINSHPLSINNNIIPQQENVKYLGIHLDKKLN